MPKAQATSPGPPPPSRRGVLRLLYGATWLALVGAVGLGLGAVLRLVSSGGGPAQPGPVELGPAQGLDVGQASDHGPVALVRDQGGYFALSLVCPHLGCRPSWQQAQGRFLCPCHGSSFALDGQRLSGPAPKGLSHVALKITGGKLVAYPGQQVDPATRLEV
ncbi:MAG: ubiquinol-cytochrome c reductase iron-sulfur subunit [Proteobacteria bacterium]|nr:ubiquinol-cytochrome c reductase iron-sulfur subunit [Pseudomonadota bacterium]MBU2468563.1 ubiquinol-cytochrome c reductase iron-sulfur subunit [Pseudomonadota bacterium]MBU2516447.1 ubiquinol-cytochrome c reductase iron-sulfur subunit [Pseudomonadota bacterium]